MASSIGGAVATKKPKINGYVSPEILQGIESLMEAEDRTKSQMIEILLREALTARGVLKSKLLDSDSKS